MILWLNGAHREPDFRAARIRRFVESRRSGTRSARGRCQPMSEEPFRTIFEPFRIHSVEPMRLTTRAERTAALAAAGYTCSSCAQTYRIHPSRCRPQCAAGWARNCGWRPVSACRPVAINHSATIAATSVASIASLASTKARMPVTSITMPRAVASAM